MAFKESDPYRHPFNEVRAIHERLDVLQAYIIHYIRKAGERGVEFDQLLFILDIPDKHKDLVRKKLQQLLDEGHISRKSQ